MRSRRKSGCGKRSASPASVTLVEIAAGGRGKIFAGRRQDPQLGNIDEIEGSHEIDAQRSGRSAGGESDENVFPIALLDAGDDRGLFAVLAVCRVKNLDEGLDLSWERMQPSFQSGVNPSAPFGGQRLRPFARDQDRFVPLVALRIVLRKFFPLGARVKHFEAGVARDGAKSIGKNPPAIERETVLGARRRRDDAAESARFQNARDLEDGFPKKFGVFEGLTRDQHVHTFRFELAPVIRIAQDEVHIFAGLEIGADVTPRRAVEQRPIRTVVIATAEIDDRERRVLQRAEIIPAELSHLIVGALVHRSAQVVAVI